MQLDAFIFTPCLQCKEEMMCFLSTEEDPIINTCVKCGDRLMTVLREDEGE